MEITSSPVTTPTTVHGRWLPMSLCHALKSGDLGAEVAFGEEPGRIYAVEATRTVEDDPNLTDKKYQGNPTFSYHSGDPLRVIGEVIDWQGYSAEELENMRAGVARAWQAGVDAVED